MYIIKKQIQGKFMNNNAKSIPVTNMGKGIE